MSDLNAEMADIVQMAMFVREMLYKRLRSCAMMAGMCLKSSVI